MSLEGYNSEDALLTGARYIYKDTYTLYIEKIILKNLLFSVWSVTIVYS
jgi:DNA-directed RNA polymerase beta subunit